CMVTTRRRFVTPEDLASFRFAGDPQISPDGSRVLYAVKVVDGEKYSQHLWIDDDPFTLGQVTDAAPRWPPDGRRIAFVRTKDEESQVWLMSISGGEPSPVTSLPPGKITALEWSPDGSRLAIVFHKDADPSLRKEKKQPTLRHITRLHYKEEGTGLLDRERDHLHVVWIGDKRTVQLTDGEWDDADPAWSPDGLWIAFVSNRQPDADYCLDVRDVWVVARREADRVPGPRRAQGRLGREERPRLAGPRRRRAARARPDAGIRPHVRGRRHHRHESAPRRRTEARVEPRRPRDLLHRERRRIVPPLPDPLGGRSPRAADGRPARGHQLQHRPRKVRAAGERSAQHRRRLRLLGGRGADAAHQREARPVRR